MTNEVIKALMVCALYAALEITLFFPSIGRLAKRAAHSRTRPTAGGVLTRRPQSD